MNSPALGVQITERVAPQPEQVRGNVAEAVAVYPCLDGVAIVEAKTDRAASSTVDDIPIIDRVPGITNTWFATGWSGHGWAIAPAVSQLMATWALKGRCRRYCVRLRMIVLCRRAVP